ncbi:hypothetical protein SS05631_b56580 (plasmid) [Sinorhizobium sp. CCBAU 05631]|nr:hypothetical protein SS05631_b56580 [Sinorhizobium sp. CCBAU 05631]
MFNQTELHGPITGVCFSGSDAPRSVSVVMRKEMDERGAQDRQYFLE